jgi:hypothetical protein
MRNISKMSIKFDLYGENTMFIYCYPNVEQNYDLSKEPNKSFENVQRLNILLQK